MSEIVVTSLPVTIALDPENFHLRWFEVFSVAKCDVWTLKYGMLQFWQTNLGGMLPPRVVICGL